MIATHVAAALLLAILASEVDQGRLDRHYPFPPSTDALRCRPIDPDHLECWRPDGSRFTCVPNAERNACKGAQL
jgi:hypothetical protein